MTSRFTVKGGVVAAAATLAMTMAAPAAQADAVDDLLARIPAGQISCSQAESYWTNASDYQSKRSQALAIAPFHRRGGEIRAAIGRLDEAVARCGLNNKVGTGNGTVQPAPNNSGNQAPGNRAPGNNAPSNNAPAPRPGQNAPRPSAPAQSAPKLPVIDLSIPGQPFVTAPLFNVALVKIPDLNKIAANATKGTPLEQLSSR